MQKDKTAIVSMDKQHLGLDVSSMENWFATSGKWVFRYMPNASRYITSTLEDSPKTENVEFRNIKEKMLEYPPPQQGIELKIVFEQYNRGTPVRLVPFVGQLKNAIQKEKNDDVQAAIWAIKIDPLISWLREHSGGVSCADETLCENRAISLFAAIGSGIKTSEPPWIVPLKDRQSADDRWFLIPHGNENFMVNLEQAFQFGKEQLMNGRVLSVADFFNPLKIDNRKCVIVKMII